MPYILHSRPRKSWLRRFLQQIAVLNMRQKWLRPSHPAAQRISISFVLSWIERLYRTSESNVKRRSEDLASTVVSSIKICHIHQAIQYGGNNSWTPNRYFQSFLPTSFLSPRFLRSYQSCQTLPVLPIAIFSLVKSIEISIYLSQIGYLSARPSPTELFT